MTEIILTTNKEPRHTECPKCGDTPYMELTLTTGDEVRWCANDCYKESE